MSFAEELVAAFAPWQSPDLDTYLQTLGEMFHEVEWYAEDTDDYDGWTVLFDPARAKYKDLRWLGQVIGEDIPVGHPEPLMREWIRDKVNQRRGSIQAVLYAAQRHLTGSRIVTWQERSASLAAVGADVDALLIITYADQTPQPDLTLRDLLDAVPGDIVLHFEVQSGQRWSTVKTNHASWSAVKAAYTDWAQVRTTNLVAEEGNTISRPIPVT